MEEARIPFQMLIRIKNFVNNVFGNNIFSDVDALFTKQYTILVLDDMKQKRC